MVFTKLKVEDELNLYSIWKMTSTFLKKEDDLKFFNVNNLDFSNGK